MKKIIAILLLLSPSFTFAQVKMNATIQYENTSGYNQYQNPTGQYSPVYGNGGIRDINDVANKATSIGDLVIVLSISLAVVWIIVSVVRYLIAGGEEDRKKGGMAVLYGVVGLFLIFSIWGLVYLLGNTFRFANNQKPSFDNLRISKPF